MEKPTHYVEARILPLDGDLLSRGDMAFVTSRIMSAVHLAIVDGLKIAVSFPEFQQKFERNPETGETKMAGTGSIVRFFGTMNDLMSFIVRQDFARLVGEAACRLTGASPIREVPVMVAWGLFKRDRSIEKSFEGFVERENRRFERIGFPDLEKIKKPRSIKEFADRTHFAHFNATSSSTGQKFSIFLRREILNDFSSRELNTYGLNVSVPIF